MTDETDSFEASEGDTLELRMPDGTTYEFQAKHAPRLKAMFTDLEIDGADVPDLEWSGENFRE
ncbi:hypothetical protein [Natrinema pallidum]|uniref:Uncharacterized protein n=1 Tax=Natrinema pallidum TaxID=69527 RepID=A0A4P9TJT0_9EURY|nr:hypothetical protein [Natrinema pallidum]QCW05258.1 hypothetical protein FGF80_18605 [Natrinema pallidum]